MLRVVPAVPIRLSTHVTRCCRAISASHRWEPMKPAPPVTTEWVNLEGARTARGCPSWIGRGRLPNAT